MSSPTVVDAIRSDADAWNIYTRNEEYGSGGLDEHSRFVYPKNSSQNIEDPMVSRMLQKRGFTVDYPEHKNFAVVLTHDVDQIYPSWKRSIISSARWLRHLDIRAGGHELTWRLGGRESSPYRNIHRIMKTEERFGGRSSFYFMTDGPDFTGSGYSAEAISSDIAQAADGGWEVGLHGSYAAYVSKEEISKEKSVLEKIIGRKIEGYRNHFLRFKVPETWRALKDSGFLYDTTMGYAEHIGFRNGMIHPFKPYDLEKQEEIDLIELPLAIMDCTLFSYMGLSLQEGWDIITRLLNTAKETNGALVVLWHNDTFANPQLKDWARMYEKMLERTVSENGWLCSGAEMAQWWRGHGF